jgi:hypothetical protein
MAHGTVEVINPTTDEVKFVPVGYSWTVLFWGFFPPLVRQDWKFGVIIAGVLIGTALIWISWIPLILFSFMYNDKMYLKSLLENGWKIKKYTGKKNLDVVQASVGLNLSKFMVDAV